MKTLEKGHEKIKRICDVLKQETLEPAQQQAEEMIANANKEAERLLIDAKQQAKQLIEEARRIIEQERKIFQLSLEQASKQCVETLKQKVEHQLFNDNLDSLIIEETSPNEIISRLINAIVTGIETEGISKDFTIYIPACSSSNEVARLLLSGVLKNLETSPLVNGTFKGGVQVKLHDKKLTLVITEKEISEFLKHYVRKDLRKYIFKS